MNSETTLRDVFMQFQPNFARKDFKEVSNYKCNQVTYDPSEEEFAEVLITLKKTAEQEFGDKASERVEASLFGMLPIQI